MFPLSGGSCCLHLFKVRCSWLRGFLWCGMWGLFSLGFSRVEGSLGSLVCEHSLATGRLCSGMKSQGTSLWAEKPPKQRRNKALLGVLLHTHGTPIPQVEVSLCEEVSACTPRGQAWRGENPPASHRLEFAEFVVHVHKPPWLPRPERGCQEPFMLTADLQCFTWL